MRRGLAVVTLTVLLLAGAGTTIGAGAAAQGRAAQTLPKRVDLANPKGVFGMKPDAHRVKPIRDLVRPAGPPAIARAPRIARSSPRLSLPVLAASHSTSGQASAPVPAAAPHTGVTNPIVNQPGLQNSNNGSSRFSPPDSTGAIGPNDYVEMVNSVVTDYDRNLVTRSTSNFNNFLGVPADFGICDPQVQWDQASNRWLFVLLDCNAPAGFEEFFFGWSKTADPSNLSAQGGGGWCAYALQTTSGLQDYPKLGHNNGWMIVGTNVFQDPSFNFVGSGVWTISKPPNGTGNPCALPAGVNLFGPLTNADTSQSFTPVPVDVMTSSAPGYVVAAHDPGPFGKVTIWRVDSAGMMQAPQDVGVTAFAFPTNAQQPSGGQTLDTMDTRITQAAGDPTTSTGIWFQHTIADSGRSAVRWYQFQVYPFTGSTSTVVKAQEGNVTDSSTWVFNGAIAPRLDGKGAAIFYNRASTSQTAMIAARVRVSGTPSGTMELGEILIASGGVVDTDPTCTGFGGPPCRWGDYAGASSDPVQLDKVWGTNMMETLQPGADWSTRNFEVVPAVVPRTPTGLSARADNHSAILTWTPDPFDPGTPITGFVVTAYQGASPVASTVAPAGATAVLFPNLTNGATYTFTIFADDIIGASPESSHTGPVTPGRQAQPSPGPTPPGRGVNPTPGATPPPR